MKTKYILLAFSMAFMASACELKEEGPGGENSFLLRVEDGGKALAGTQVCILYGDRPLAANASAEVFDACGVTDAQGHVAFTDLRDGTYTLRAWHRDCETCEASQYTATFLRAKGSQQLTMDFAE